MVETKENKNSKGSLTIFKQQQQQQQTNNNKNPANYSPPQKQSTSP